MIESTQNMSFEALVKCMETNIAQVDPLADYGAGTQIMRFGIVAAAICHTETWQRVGCLVIVREDKDEVEYIHSLDRSDIDMSEMIIHNREEYPDCAIMVEIDKGNIQSVDITYRQIPLPYRMYRLDEE